MYLATIYPDRISVRYDWNKKSARTRWEEKKVKEKRNFEENLKKKKQNWKLSYQSKRKIYDSVNYMNSVSPSRTIKTKSGRLIYNFRCAFITLTLPSVQIHEDKEIKNVLNNFLTTLRQKFNLKNYLWKAELQKNENIHFHLVIDKYIHHHAIRYYWNKAINVLGYVDRYTELFENMSLKEYAEHRGVEVAKAVSGFVEGRKTNWVSPPTENVQAVRSKKMLAYYIGKYIVKNVKESEEVSVEEIERIQNFGRVWARSQSLSRIKFITRYCWSELSKVIREIDKNLQSFDIVKYDYCTSLYVNGERALKELKGWMQRVMKDLAVTYQYPIPDI